MTAEMEDSPYIYGIRYYIEKWDKPRPENPDDVEVVPGIVLNKGSDFGYTDVLFIASILLSEDCKEIDSIALFDSIGGAKPHPGVLKAVRDQINHYLEHHT